MVYASQELLTEKPVLHIKSGLLLEKITEKKNIFNLELQVRRGIGDNSKIFFLI